MVKCNTILEYGVDIRNIYTIFAIVFDKMV